MAKIIKFLSILALVIRCSLIVSGLFEPGSKSLTLEPPFRSSWRRIGPDTLSSTNHGQGRSSGPRAESSNSRRLQSKMQTGGFKAGVVFDVIHRQHPNSPFRQEEKSWTILTRESLRRGMLREQSLKKMIEAERKTGLGATGEHGRRLNEDVTHIPKPEKLVKLPVLPAPSTSAEYWLGEYLVQMQIGTPPKPVLLIIDTGSGLTWVQCAPCIKCFTQQEPIFNRSNSSTYEPVTCPSAVCSSSSIFQCAGAHNETCEYGIQYNGQASFTTGILSKDTLLVNSLVDASEENVAIEQFLFGCGVYNMGDDFVGNSGILGLSRSNISFPTQLASGLNYPKKFTHCFADLAADRNSTSFIYFGDEPTNSIPNHHVDQLKYTPLAVTPFATQFYYIGLCGFSVNGHLLPINSSVFEVDQNGNGGTVIDSGTTVTLLLPDAYNLLRDAFRSAGKKSLPMISVGGFNSNSTGHVLDTCYRLNHKGKDIEDYDVPSITLHFSTQSKHHSLLDLTLPRNNVLFPFDDEGLYCLAFASTLVEAGVNVLGNIQQQNFKIEYDLESSRIGFARASCASESW